MGDPAGVGPELCLKAAAHPAILEQCVPRIYGSRTILKSVANRCSLPIEESDIVDLPFDDQAFEPGKISEQTGQASFDFVTASIDAVMANDVAAVVTAPIHKEAWNAAGIDYPGHTELFAEKAKSDEFCMLMTSPRISCSLVTCHVGLSSVPSLLSQERILEVIVLTYEALKKMRKREPRLIVLGLNPHAGENGLFGRREEERFIVPAIEAAREQGIEIEGPLPPDTAFLPWKLDWADAHVCMYHDQGLIPFKALAFDCGINTTLGLPIIRTSVDHGTALDIAWQNKADPSSMYAAVELAVSLTR